MKMRGQHYTPAASSLANKNPTHFIESRRASGPVYFEEEKITLPLRGIETCIFFSVA
jgi:hypothetical protein